MKVMGGSLLLLAVLMNCVSSRHYDKSETQQESYDDSWMNVNIDDHHHHKEAEGEELERRQDLYPDIEEGAIEEEIRAQLEGLDSADKIMEYVDSEASLALFQWELLSKLLRDPIDTQDDTIRWIINDKDALEQLVTSGDIDNDEWNNAVQILADIIRQDPNAKTGLKLKLAVATALTFSSRVTSLADGSAIEGIPRYHNFAKWADDGEFLEPFYNLTAWEMRYVVGSWAQDDELVWARENALEDYRNPNKIGSVTHKMVAYNLYNADGVSVHSADYYYGKPVTLEWIHTIGGVCGAISKFGTAMAQAFGIPGLPVGQPGHCAFIWLRDGTYWYLDNDVSGWAKSATHTGIQYTWQRQAPFFTMMYEAQHKLENYRASEKLRLIATSFISDLDLKFSILEEGSTLCAQNYDLWQDLRDVMSTGEVDEDIIERRVLPYLETMQNNFLETRDVALGKSVSASAGENRAHWITKDGGEWYSDEETGAWIEIDLEFECEVDDMKIWWWGTSYASAYSVLARIGDEWVEVAGKSDETRQSNYYNPWGSIPGWEGKTSAIRMELETGNLDPWFGKYYFGIREVVLNGRAAFTTVNISAGQPVTISPGVDEGAHAGDNLVDGNLATSLTWPTPKLSVQLPAICLTEAITTTCGDGGCHGTQDISLVVGGQEVAKETDAPFDSMVKVATNARHIVIRLKGDSSFTLSEVEAIGTCFSSRDIIKEQMKLGFKDPTKDYTVYVTDDVSALIDNFQCETCY